MTPALGNDLAARLAGVVGGAHVGELALPPDGRVLPEAAPADEAEARELLRFAARERLALVPLGLGSKLADGAAPVRADFALSTRRIAGVVDYESGDGTITARAGTTMAALAAVARSGGHHLSPDVPRPAQATLGGVVAAGTSGADRLRHGPVRHQVLGTRVVLGDGRVAKSGGRLVKNVTGFDLHRLHVGSRGSLCLVLEVSLRLYPLPEHEDVLALDVASSARALELARAALALPVRPMSLSFAHTAGGAWSLAIHLAGRREVVDAERATVARAWPDAVVSEGEAAREHAARLRDGFAVSEVPRLEIGCLPASVERVLASLERAASARGLALRLAVHPALARIDAELRAAAGTAPDPRVVAGLVRELRAARAESSAATVVLCAGGAAALEVDPCGEPGPALALSRRVQAALDPGLVFARGRFHGGL